MKKIVAIVVIFAILLTCGMYYLHVELVKIAYNRGYNQATSEWQQKELNRISKDIERTKQETQRVNLEIERTKQKVNKTRKLVAETEALVDQTNRILKR